MSKMNHLERAKEYLAIAESSDSKKEAYRAAAEEIAAAVAEGESQRTVATVLRKSQAFVLALLNWRKSGYKADTPWLADEKATTRAAKSHTRRVLSDPELAHEIISNLDDETLKQVTREAKDETVARTLYPDRIKPKHEDSVRRQAAKQAERLAKNPTEAVDRVGALLARGRGVTRQIVLEYQNFLALVEDEDLRAYTKEMLVAYATDTGSSIIQAAEGSVDEALDALLAEGKEGE
jgi:hypothetical protein